MLPTKSMKMLPLAINIRQLSRGIDISQQIGVIHRLAPQRRPKFNSVVIAFWWKDLIPNLIVIFYVPRSQVNPWKGIILHSWAACNI